MEYRYLALNNGKGSREGTSKPPGRLNRWFDLDTRQNIGTAERGEEISYVGAGREGSASSYGGASM